VLEDGRADLFCACGRGWRGVGGGVGGGGGGEERRREEKWGAGGPLRVCMQYRDSQSCVDCTASALLGNVLVIPSCILPLGHCRSKQLPCPRTLLQFPHRWHGAFNERPRCNRSW